MRLWIVQTLGEFEKLRNKKRFLISNTKREEEELNV